MFLGFPKFPRRIPSGAQTQFKARKRLYCQRRTGFEQGGALLNAERSQKASIKRFQKVFHGSSPLSQDELSPGNYWGII